MCLIRPGFGGATALTLATLALTQSGFGLRADLSPAATIILYETGFEPFEGFSPNEDLLGQGGWTGAASDLSGNSAPLGGNGVLAGPIAGFRGQYAYLGFAAATNTADFNLWHPVNLKPVTQPLPRVRFQVSFQIQDSTSAAPHFDDFRWSIYSAENHRFLSLDFDNESREVNFILDGNQPEILPTGFTFDNGIPYDLELDLNLQRNRWTARINGTVIVNAQPITTVNEKLTFGDADAVWVIRTPGQPGDNYMIFDDYRITLEPLSDIPPTLEPIGMLNTGAFVIRVIGEPGVTYQLEGSDNFHDWLPIATGQAQSPGGYVDLQDSAASAFPQRVYRAQSLP